MDSDLMMLNWLYTPSSRWNTNAFYPAKVQIELIGITKTA